MIKKPILEAHHKEYIKEKLDENGDNLTSLFGEQTNGFNRAMIMGIKLHELAVMKELELITKEEYDSKYGEGQRIMSGYYAGEGGTNEEPVNHAEEILKNALKEELLLPYEAEDIDGCIGIDYFLAAQTEAEININGRQYEYLEQLKEKTS